MSVFYGSQVGVSKYSLIGKVWIRRRVCSNTTILPCSSASWIMGRFDNKRAICFSGWRSDPLLKRITDGLLFLHKARNTPKSVSDEISIRFSVSASEKPQGTSLSGHQWEFPFSHRFSSIPESSLEIFRLEIWICPQNPFLCHTICYPSHHRSHWNA